MDKKTNKGIIGKNIRHYRIHAGFSQKTAGEKLGVTPQQIQKYENGSSSVISERLAEMATLFNCPISAFFNGIAGNAQPAHKCLNPYLVQLLLSHFERITSRKLRGKICGIVETFADLAESEITKKKIP